VHYCHVSEGGRLRFQIWRSTGSYVATAFVFTMFLPSQLHSRRELLPRYKRWSNKVSNLKIHGRFFSHCQKK